MDSNAGPACAGMNTEVFFAGPDSEAGQVAPWERAALRVCAPCPVRAGCLMEALRFSSTHQWGVVGGTTATQRREFLREFDQHPVAS
jgi:Transcription factor WhiB